MPLRVCFVALNAYPAIDPRVPGEFGGIETRSWLFARALARLPDLEVSFAVRHWQALRQPRYENVSLILMRDRLYPLRNSVLSRLHKESRFPWFRLRHPRLSDVVALPLLAVRKALVRQRHPTAPNPFYQQVEADLFLTFGVQSNSASVIASAHSTGRLAVLFLGSDSDLDERYAISKDFVSVYRDPADVCLWTIQQADQILCQTESQRELLQQRFGRVGELIRNPIDLEEWDRLMTKPIDLQLTAGLKRYALWVGRSDPDHKRPQTLLELARRCPEAPFLMIMNPRDDVLDAQIRQQAPANVRIVTSVPFENMPAVTRRAAVLVNTSSLEGFPNTFLQAAVSGVPIASLNVDPKFPREAEAGFCAGGDIEALAGFVRRAWSSRDQLRDPLPARRFVEEHHSLTAQAQRLAESLRNVARSRV